MTLTQEELGKRIMEAKQTVAVNYRDQVMLTKPTLDLPNPKKHSRLQQRDGREEVSAQQIVLF